MNKVSFLGRVLPEHVRANLSKGRAVKWETDDGAEIEYSIMIENARVAIVCNAKNDLARAMEWRDMGQKAIQLANAIVSTMAFQTQCHLSLLLDQVSVDGGPFQNLGFGEANQPGLWCKSFSMEQDSFHGMLDLIMVKPRAATALGDLNASMRGTPFAIAYHGRAIDGIRHAMSKESPDKSWLKLRETLHVSKRYIDYITKERSAKLRHAEHIPLEGDEQYECFKRAWMIMDRYLEYLKRGEVGPLPLEEFPLLDSEDGP